jgi:signal transduction histidine kinase
MSSPEAQKEAQTLADLVRSPFAAQLIAAMPEPAVIVGSDERAAAANKPALSLLPGLRVGDPLVLGLRAPDVIDARRRVMASGEAETVQWSERVPVERLFDVSVAPLATASGQVVATLITLRDQTEARRVERLRVDFIANASHELRTPLSVLRTEVDVTLSDPAADVAELRRMGTVVRDATRRADELIAGLLLLARTEGAELAEVRPVDLADIVVPALAAVRAEAGQRGLRVQVHTTPAPAHGDLVLLERVAGNLLENAVRHNVTGGWVEVRTGVVGAVAELRVASSGPEIPGERVPELFEPFRRGPVERTGAVRGSGLGLSIVRAVVVAHGGTVAATPVKGGGLMVAVQLPS